VPLDAELASASDPDARPQSVEPWAVYLLACAGGKSYVGISPRPEERFAAHCAGRGGAFTRANPPQRCVRVVWFDGRRAAASLEVRLKAMTRERKWQWFAEFPETTPEQTATLETGLARWIRHR
jgi:putative endonuclease